MSPWLERTRWLQHLDSVNLPEAARLLDISCLQDQPVLGAIVFALDHLVAAAYESVCTDRINFFAQKRIAAFLPTRSG